jgi:tetraacyldisaccharide 4'-kinase
MKTPAVVELGRVLSSRGPRVGVIGHGYRGSNRGVCVVSNGRESLASVETAGDEAVLIAHELPGCPVVVGRDKVAAGRVLEEQFGRQIILVDSGFQHLRLYRDIDIVCVTEEDLGRLVMPSGMLREFPSTLRHADMIFTERASDGARVAKLRDARPGDVFSLARKEFAFYPLEGAGEEQPKPEKAFVFCGIGRPQAFLRDVRALGVQIVGQRIFRDHHRYSEGEVAGIAREAEESGAVAVVATTKDAVRLRSWPSKVPFLVLGARLDIDELPRVLKRIDSMILARIKAGL